MTNPIMQKCTAEGIGTFWLTFAGCDSAVIAAAVLYAIANGSPTFVLAKGFASIDIGLALPLLHLVGVPITNSSVNPVLRTGPGCLAACSAASSIAG